MEATRTRVEEKIDSFVEGDLEHAAETLSAFWEVANKDGDVKAPSNTTTAVSSCFLSAAWWYLYSAYPGHAGNESGALGVCKDGTHQVDSYRRLLRQKVLGQTFQVWPERVETRLLFEYDHER